MKQILFLTIAMLIAFCGFAKGQTKYAYAIYDSGTLTFYYDDKISNYDLPPYELILTNDNFFWYGYDGRQVQNLIEFGVPCWYNKGESIKAVVFDPSFEDYHPKTTKAWFYDHKNLESIEGLQYLNTDKVTDMSYMFHNCNKLSSLNLTKFNTSRVENMRGMFDFCYGLASLDLTSFNVAKVTDMFGMFYNCSNLITIYVEKGWSTQVPQQDEEPNYMFEGCEKLVGGAGTVFDEKNPNDITYACIDGGSSSPGYFTYKKPTIVTTEIGEVLLHDIVQSALWYSINGRKLSGKPTQKGIYLHNGKKVVIK